MKKLNKNIRKKILTLSKRNYVSKSKIKIKIKKEVALPKEHNLYLSNFFAWFHLFRWNIFFSFVLFTAPQTALWGGPAPRFEHGTGDLYSRGRDSAHYRPPHLSKDRLFLLAGSFRGSSFHLWLKLSFCFEESKISQDTLAV